MMNGPSLRSAFGIVAAFALASVTVTACNTDKNKPGTGLVVADASGPVAAEAGATTDLSQCTGCSLAPIPAWTFEGVYKDAQCTEPVAQLVTPSCGSVPALGVTNLTYVDAVGLRKANETASVTLADQVSPETPRYRKAGATCVRSNEGAVDVTPAGCAGQRVCRDANGALTCAGCRTFANGCPDFEETRLYASITDPGLKATGGTGGSNSLARLAQCCAAITAEGKRLGPSPEGGMIIAAGAQCSALVQAAGPNGNAPELGAVKGMLAGRQLPAVCSGL
ncbi:MAG: hypothetical protein JWP97_3260 [Labilithrix sp.]|nr:hypothetical protein [Labilithrix sp.]